MLRTPLSLYLAALLLVGLQQAASAGIGDQLDLRVEGPQPDSQAAVLLALARADVAIVAARRAYAGSEFGRCIRRMHEAEDALARAIRPDGGGDAAQNGAASWHLLERVNLWLGLCLAVSGRSAEADHTFRRAIALGGTGPDPALFPPAVMGRFRRLMRQRGRCELQLPVGARWLDGRPLAGARRVAVAPGQHYLVHLEPQRGLPRSGRVVIDARCGLGPLPLAGANGLLGTGESQDTSLLVAIGHRARCLRIRLLSDQGGETKQRLFDVPLGQFVRWYPSRVASAARTTTSAPSGVAGPATPPVPAALPGGAAAPVGDTALVPMPSSKPQVLRRRWYRKWWVWALVGAAAGVAVAVPLLAQPSPRYQVSFR